MVWLVNEEHNQIPTCLCLPQSSIYIIAAAIPLLDKTELEVSGRLPRRKRDAWYQSSR